MLNFVNFRNGSIYVPRHILDVMLRILSNVMMAKLSDKSAYIGM